MVVQEVIEGETDDGSEDMKDNEGGEGVENDEEMFTNLHTSLGEGQHRLFSGKVHRG
jgi:hypothetical protein